MFKSISLRNFEFLLPNKNDNIKQIANKILYITVLLVIIAALIVNCCFTISQIKIINNEKVFKSIWLSKSSNKFEKAKEINNEFCGWLKIDGTKIDYPVFKADDNVKYTYINATGNTDYNGALFFDKDTKLNEQNHYVIYGNNGADNSLFGTLEKYMSVFYYKENPVITLNISKDEKYIIYSAMLLSSYDDGENFFDIYRDSFSDSKNFENWVSESKERSIYSTNIEISYDDETLALVTSPTNCDTKRFVVLARKLRSGEDAKKLASNAVVNQENKN